MRLTCKLANFLNGLNVTHNQVGDVIEVSEAEGQMLIAEGWAERVSKDTEADASNEFDSQDRTG